MYKNNVNFIVKTKEQNRQTLIDIAKNIAGFRWCQPSDIDEYLYFKHTNDCKEITHSNTRFHDSWPLLSFEEACAVFTGYKTLQYPYKEIRVKDYSVKIFPNEKIEYGCTIINKEQVEEIIQLYRNE